MTAGSGELRARLSGITKVFETGSQQSAIHALGPVDLDLAAGEFVTVVGPSGCGKTTLLETLAGLTRPSAGTVTFEGKAVADKVPRGIGIVFQEDASLPWLTVWDNIAFGLRRAGMPAGEIRARVGYAVSFMGLGAFAAAYPAQLSGGMRSYCSRASSFSTSLSARSTSRPVCSWATRCCGCGARPRPPCCSSPTRSTRR
jgi:NitT/TauT family transport system ATP-binding protein